jgi:hypothetical protein
MPKKWEASVETPSERVLSEVGYAVVLAGDGRAALDLTASHEGVPIVTRAKRPMASLKSWWLSSRTRRSARCDVDGT